MNNRKSGIKDGYKWEAKTKTCCAGWLQTYYNVIAPNGEMICDNFTNGPLEDGISACKTAIEDHKNGYYEEDV